MDLSKSHDKEATKTSFSDDVNWMYVGYVTVLKGLRRMTNLCSVMLIQTNSNNTKINFASKAVIAQTASNYIHEVKRVIDFFR